jgi:putative FmdB family regulatory protein
MATYEFHCQKCDLNFEPMFSFGQYQKKTRPIRCPNCNSTRVVRRISFLRSKLRKRVNPVGGPANVSIQESRRPDERA